MRHQSQVKARSPHTPRTPAQLLDKAEQLVSTDRHPRAVAAATALAEEAITHVESTPDSVTTQVQTLVRASELLNRVGEYARTVLACRRALRLMPGHAHASFNAARALRYLGLLPQAEAVLEPALADHPHDGDLLRLQAELARLQGHHEQAVTLLRQALSGAPEDGVAWYILSIASLHLQRYQEALEAAERAIALETPPEVADAWASKGIALEELGDDAGAIAAYRQAICISGGQFQAHVGLARLYRKHDQLILAWRERLAVRWMRAVYSVSDHLNAQRLQEELLLLRDGNVNDMGPSLL